MRFKLSLLSIISFAAACHTVSSSEEGSLATRCAIATAVEKTTTDSPGDPTPLPDSPDDCPVCRDADGNPLPPDACVVHDYVCKEEPTDTTRATLVDHELAVITAAENSPAIAYYGACDGAGGTCEQRDFAYALYGNEVAVATFSNHETHVYKIPEVSPGVRVTAVRAHQPIFPLLLSSASYYNVGVQVVFVTDDGETIMAGGDIQNDCRVTADAGGSEAPNPNVPCWCTQC